MTRRLIAMLLIATVIPTFAGITQDTADCTQFGRIDEMKFCLGPGAGYLLDGELNRFAGSGASMPITIAEGADLTINLAKTGASHEFSMVRFVSARHFESPLDFPGEVLGPFNYGPGSGNPVVFSADDSLSTLLQWQANSGEDVIVAIESDPEVNFEGFIGIRLIIEEPPPVPRDYGDAPAPYPTLRSDNGAAHDVTSGLEMRNPMSTDPSVDLENDGQPDADARGDDMNAMDDERGVNTPPFGLLIPGTMASVDIFASEGGGQIVAFIDFNGNGAWDDPQERIIDHANANAGSNTYQFAVPANAALGETFGRFRISTELELGALGVAGDGEVEDHLFFIGKIDLGDAPNAYGTTLLSGGPAHLVGTDIVLGTIVDDEPDGQPGPSANFDDNNGFFDDEDGLIFIRPIRVPTTSGFLFPGEDSEMGITYGGNQPGFVSAWIDYDLDGTFDNPGERIFTDQRFDPMTSRILNFTVPATADFGLTYVRLRAYPGAVGNPSPTGIAGFILPTEGEVEDHEIVMTFGLDFGDAPGSYNTLFDDGGPAHAVLVDFNLGAAIDAEEDGQPTLMADGDDNSDAADDEDGIEFRRSGELNLVRINRPETVEVLVDSEQQGELHTWIDANLDGDFKDPGEKVIEALAVAAGSNQVTFQAPAEAISGPTYMRFRYVKPQAENAPAIGPDDIDATLLVGEVEDYLVEQYVEIHRSSFENDEGPRKPADSVTLPP